MATITKGNGNDFVVGTNAADTITTQGGTDFVFADGGNDIVSAGDGSDFVDGGAGNDVIDGGNGADYLLADNGADLVFGGAGADFISTGAGQDRAYGGSGNDIIDARVPGSSAGDGDILFGDGYDSYAAYLAGATPGTVPGNDTLYGSGGVDTIYGDNGNNAAAGGIDTVYAGGGNDAVYGEGGNDNLYGESGNDSINGGAGNDSLTGGTGADTLTGGADADKFIFNATTSQSDSTAAATDIITDFAQGSDKIDLTALLGSTNLAWGGTTPKAKGVWYQQSGGNTYIYADVSGNTTAELVIRLNGLYTLTSSDFAGVTAAATPTPTLSNDTASAQEDLALAATGNVLSNDTGSGLTVTGVRFGANVGTVGSSLSGTYGSLLLNSNGTYTYTLNNSLASVQALAAGQVVQEVFTYTATNAGGSGTATLTLSITGNNDAPTIAASVNASGDEDNVITGTAAGTDLDTGAVIHYGATNGAYGTVSIDSDTGAWSYTPAANFNGTDSFNITVTDGSGATATQIVNITVNAVNDAPVASNTSISTNEDTGVSGNLPVGTDADGNAITYSLATVASNGTAVVNADGTYSYTPNANFNGNDSFSYTVSDGNGGSNTYVVSVTIGAVNDVPVASNTSITTSEDTAITGNLPSATDADGDTVTYSLAVAASSGTAVVNGDGNYIYTPNANFSGSDSFSYTVSDGNGGSNTYAVNVTVDPVNDAPVATDTNIDTNEDTPLNGTLPAASDADGDAVTYSLAVAASNGTAVVNDDGSYSYTPNADFNGSDSFSYTVIDGNGGSNTYTVNAMVKAVNDAPITGIVTTAIGPRDSFDYGYSVTVQADGKILVAGVGATSSGGSDFALVRYNPDGSLDTSFGGGDGIVTTAIGLYNGDDLGYSVTVQADGKILVAGKTSTSSGGSDFALVRYNADGSLDTSFGGGDGIVTTAITTAVGLYISGDVGYSLTMQADGKILVAGGYTYTSAGGSGESDFALVRYNADGSLDTSFGDGDGIVTTDIAGNSDFGLGVTVQADGRILVAGRATFSGSSDFALARYNTDGSLDTSFGGGDGIVTTAIGPGINDDMGSSVTVQADGKILVAGGSWSYTSSSGYDFALVRYNADGSLDTSFGSGDGIVTTDLGPSDYDFGYSVTVQADGKILVAGVGATNSSGGGNFALVRYNTDGTLDTSFGGGDGVVTTAIGLSNSYDVGYSVTVQADGKILVAGKTSTSSGGSDFALVRYNADGSLDTSFGGLNPPVVNAGSAFSLTLPGAHLFSDSDSDVFTYTVTQADGSPLPAWLSFDGTTLSGTAPDGNDLALRLVATDWYDVNNSLSFVLRVNEAPIAASISINTAEDTAVNGSLPAANDADGDAVAYSLATAASNGTAVVNDDGSYNYTPNADFNGNDSFNYTVIDGNGGSNTYTVNVTVNAVNVNDAPTLAGIAITAIGSGIRPDYGQSVALQTDGKILVAGSAITSAGSTDFAVVRYNADGSLDTIFGDGDGIVTTAIQPGAGPDAAYSVTVQADGKILVTGYGTTSSGGQDFALIRYNEDGSFDTSFGGGDGIVTTAIGPYAVSDSGTSVTVQADGKILVTGLGYTENGAGFALVRYNTDGTLDTMFGNGDGIVTSYVGASYSTNVQADGKILVAGYGANSSGGTDFALVRYNSNGTLDTSFGGGDGIVTTAIGADGSFDVGFSMTVQADGKILVAGQDSTSSGGYDFALVRYNADGTLDTNFGGGDGVVTTDIGSGISLDEGFSVTVQADGKILVAGRTTFGNSSDFALVRYNADGTLDTSFGGGDGVVTTDIASNSDFGLGVTVQADGKILVAGYADTSSGGYDFALVRYNVDGSLDTSFGGLNPPAVSAGSAFNLTLPGAALFSDSDALTYTVTQADGSALPGWLSFNGTTLSGTASDVDDLALKLVATDPYGASTSLPFTLRIDAANNAPIASDTNINTNEDTVFDGSLPFATDADGDVITYILATDAANGVAEVWDDGTYRYTPNTDFVGSDSFTYTVSDNNGGSNTYTVSVTVGNDALVLRTGIVTTDIGFYDYGYSVTVQTDGKILVAGGSTAASSVDYDFALIRYNEDGSLDMSFGGGDGIVATDIAGSSNLGYSATVLADGKILVAGSVHTSTGGGDDFALVRYNTDGSLDTSFGGGDGFVNTDIGTGGDSGNSVAVQADGKILVAGDGYTLSGGSDFALVRYNADGSLDTGFGGGDGIATTAIGSGTGYDAGFSVKMQTDGKILVAGQSATSSGGFDFTLVRYNADGSLDTGFGGGDGIVTTAIGPGINADYAYSLAVQADDRILVAGVGTSSSTGGDFALVRYNTDGTLDTDFGGGDGIVTTAIGPGTNYDHGYSVALQADGKILVAGYGVTSSGGSDFALIRYNADGTLDTGFDDGDGIVTTDIEGNAAVGYSVTVQVDGKILVAGRSVGQSSSDGFDFVLARYNADGSLDTTFGNEAPPTDIVWNAVAAASDTALPEAGAVIANLSANSNLSLSYLLVDGADFSISTDGVVTALSDLSTETTYTVTARVTDANGGTFDETFNIITGSTSADDPLIDWGDTGAHPIDDILYGLGQDDVMYGGAGNDTLFGQEGNDTFVFENDSGRDRIMDFVAGDVIDLSAVTNPDWMDFSEVTSHASQVGADTLIDLGNGNTITLVGITLTNLTAADFVL